MTEWNLTACLAAAKNAQSTYIRTDIFKNTWLSHFVHLHLPLEPEGWVSWCSLQSAVSRHPAHRGLVWRVKTTQHGHSEASTVHHAHTGRASTSTPVHITCNAIQLYCQVSIQLTYNCTRNVLWCQVHSSHIYANHKTSLKLQQQTKIWVKSHS